MVEVTCRKCGKVFLTSEKRIESGRGRFCSVGCRAKGSITPEVREKIAASNRGRSPSLETRRKLSVVGMGHATSIETRKKISDAHKGRKFTPERCEAMSKLRKGKKTIPCSPEKRLKLHETHILRREKHWNWKGGVYDEFKNIRCSVEYRLWKSAVFEKDGHECQWCGAKEYLEADHIQTFAEHPELRFAIDNGRVLCMDCHAKRHPEYADLILGRKGFMKRSSNNSLEIT